MYFLYRYVMFLCDYYSGWGAAHEKILFLDDLQPSEIIPSDMLGTGYICNCWLLYYCGTNILLIPFYSASSCILLRSCYWLAVGCSCMTQGQDFPNASQVSLQKMQ
jgi:hypothetical protein